MIGKILYLDYNLNLKKEELNKLNEEILNKIKYIKTKSNEFNDLSKNIFNENNKNLNDIKILFKNKYNNSLIISNETFKNDNNIFYNKNFYLDSEKECLYYNLDYENEIEIEYYRIDNKDITFYFKEEVSINKIKAIMKDNDGVNLNPKEIYIYNNLGQSYFNEDFYRFFEYQDGIYETKTFLSNPKTATSIKFSFNENINIATSIFKFYDCSYLQDNEIIIKFKNKFKNSNYIKLNKKIYDKYKMLEYYISFDNGTTFNKFDWYDNEIEGSPIEDDYKLIEMPNKKIDNIFIKILSKNDIKIDSKNVIKTENYIENIVPKNFIKEDENNYEYKLNINNGRIKKETLKIYFSNKYSEIIKKYNSELLDVVTEKNKISIAPGYINIEKTEITKDNKFYLMDFDSLESLKNIGNELGYFYKDKLYLPALFYEENIYFRISYDIEYFEDYNTVDRYTPFIFDFNIIGGE